MSSRVLLNISDLPYSTLNIICVQPYVIGSLLLCVGCMVFMHRSYGMGIGHALHLFKFWCCAVFSSMLVLV